MSTAIDPAFGYWFSGFVDGEGCFDIHRINSADKDYYICRLTIGLRDDDTSILEEIQQQLGLGQITPRRTKGTINPQVAWSVSRKTEMVPLISVLDSYPLRSKKQNDYRIWREAALLWASLTRGNRWTGRNPAFDHLAAYATALRGGRRYKGQGGDLDADPVGPLWGPPRSMYESRDAVRI